MRVCVYVRRDEGCGDEEELGSHAHRSLFTETVLTSKLYDH